MSVWGVTMVKDELDVLPYTLAHMIAEGVDGLIIADNLSTDGTWEWLCEHVPSFPCETILERDEQVAYYQSVKMSGHYQHASRLGAHWVIPFDADEVWYSEDYRKLADVFTDDLDADCLEAKLYNYFPTSSDDPAKVIPFERIVHRDPMVSILPKVAVRAGIPSLVIEQGNHGARADEPLRTRQGLAIGHFPWRSPSQFESKVRNGGQAYKAATDTSKVRADQGGHWRGHGQILETDGPSALRQVYDEWFCDPPIDLQRHPVPWRR